MADTSRRVPPAEEELAGVAALAAPAVEVEPAVEPVPSSTAAIVASEAPTSAASSSGANRRFTMTTSIQFICRCGRTIMRRAAVRTLTRTESAPNGKRKSS